MVTDFVDRGSLLGLETYHLGNKLNHLNWDLVFDFKSLKLGYPKLVDFSIKHILIKFVVRKSTCWKWILLKVHHKK